MRNNHGRRKCRIRFERILLRPVRALARTIERLEEFARNVIRCRWKPGTRHLRDQRAAERDKHGSQHAPECNRHIIFLISRGVKAWGKKRTRLPRAAAYQR